MHALRSKPALTVVAKKPALPLYRAHADIDWEPGQRYKTFYVSYEDAHYSALLRGVQRTFLAEVAGAETCQMYRAGCNGIDADTRAVVLVARSFDRMLADVVAGVLIIESNFARQPVLRVAYIFPEFRKTSSALAQFLLDTWIELLLETRFKLHVPAILIDFLTGLWMQISPDSRTMSPFSQEFLLISKSRTGAQKVHLKTRKRRIGGAHDSQ